MSYRIGLFNCSFAFSLYILVTLRENGFSQILKRLAVILKCLALNHLLKASTAGAMPADSASLQPTVQHETHPSTIQSYTGIKRKAKKKTGHQQDLLVTSVPRREEEACHIFLFPTSMRPSCLQTSSVAVKPGMTLFKDIMYLEFLLVWIFRKPDLPAVYFYTILLVYMRIQTHTGLFIKTTEKYRTVSSR